MIVEIVSCVLIVAGLVTIVRYYWVTRRQPVRDDSPTSGPWVPPDPFWKD
jgi:hypothetical protein